MLPTTIAEKVVKEKNKQFKRNQTAKMSLAEDFHKTLVAYMGHHPTASPTRSFPFGTPCSSLWRQDGSGLRCSTWILASFATTCLQHPDH